jgi:hypothetical protein
MGAAPAQEPNEQPGPFATAIEFLRGRGGDIPAQ